MEKDKVEEVVDMKSCGLWRCSEKVTTWRGDLITPVVEESEEDDVGRREVWEKKARVHSLKKNT
ncbi:hypothetical protein TanjilG_02920 [Lupinus angustifolius]|uniref:Uncharacterized protein n=1 Tax=Lupinus angustifolius TaxID=3871 RepID=A0A394DE06_LUPAN|nr:hypothetical protein TanjilG_02920 [Lupinus angustifolius]